jgi:hypothetical protein
MKDIQKIKEFFSQPMKESLTGGYPHTKSSGENFEKITITEPIDDATKNKMIKNFRAAGWDAKPNNGGGITAIKKAMMEAKKETAIDMAKKQLDQLGAKYEMSGNKFKPFKVIYKPTGQSDEFYDTFEDIVDLFNLKGVVKSSIGEAKFMSGMLSGKDFINAKLKNYPKAKAKVNQLIDMIGEDKFTIEMAEWIFDFFNNAHFESPMNEAKEEDKIDTITMDVPLFIRMLEYSREDAAEDMDLHDITEKAISLNKEKDTLSMEDYDKIVGSAETMNEVNLKQSKLSSAEYQQAKKLKSFKASDWKWNADEDLYTKVVKEATDYMKRRKSEDDYPTSKEDKPKKPTTSNPSGNTDYMKRRKKELAETILAKLKN